MRRIAITGVTGFIGRGLPAMLAERGVSVTGVCRSGAGSVPGVDAWQASGMLDFAGHEAVVHLDRVSPD